MPKDFILYALFGGHFFVGTFVSYIPFLIKNVDCALPKQ